jgi:hypothetical protein
MKQTGLEGVGTIQLVLDSDKWQDLVNKAMNTSDSIKGKQIVDQLRNY